MYWHSIQLGQSGGSPTFYVLFAILSASSTPITKETLEAAMPLNAKFLCYGGGSKQVYYDFGGTTQYNHNYIPATYCSKVNYGSSTNYLLIAGVSLTNGQLIYTSGETSNSSIATLTFNDARLIVVDTVDQIF